MTAAAAPRPWPSRAFAQARELAYDDQLARSRATARLAERSVGDLLDLARRSWRLVGRIGDGDAVRFDALCMHDAAVEELLRRGFGVQLVPAEWRGNRT